MTGPGVRRCGKCWPLAVDGQCGGPCQCGRVEQLRPELDAVVDIQGPLAEQLARHAKHYSDTEPAPSFDVELDVPSSWHEREQDR